MINYAIFGFSTVAFVLVALALIFIIKEKKFENKKVKSGINAIVFGLFFLAIFIAINAINYANKIFIFEGVLPSLKVYLDYLVHIANLGFIPLIVMFFLVGMFVFKKLNRKV